jgi:thymidylate synthase (FAD)
MSKLLLEMLPDAEPLRGDELNIVPAEDGDDFNDGTFLESIPVLDHGMVRLVDCMGRDADIPEAARVSYQKGTEKVSDDIGLIRYLLRHRHTSPFEMCELKVHIVAPIFVARQVFRHRVFSINEVSARYSIMEDIFYLPSIEQMCAQSKNNKQGRAEPLPVAVAEQLRELLNGSYRESYRVYEIALKSGLARELARCALPVSIYTQWYQKGNLHNWMHFMKLRLDPHAQYEVRVYAQAVYEMIGQLFPEARDAFEEYVLHGQNLSRTEWDIIRGIAKHAGMDVVEKYLQESGIKGREKREFVAKLA